MRIQHCFSGLLLTTSLLAISIFSSGCYTQFATTNSIARASSPSTIDVEELIENGSDVTINNYYYDTYYANVLRPAIYGFGGWGWYDPFWGYPLWYTPVIVPVAYYGWGGWGWNRWAGWNPYFPPVWGGAVASTAPVGTRRTGIGRTRATGMENSSIYPVGSSLRYGSSRENGIAPSSRRQRTGTTTTAPATTTRRSSTGRSVERKSSGTSSEKWGSYSAPSRRQSSGTSSSPSYSPPSSTRSSSASTPSRSGGGSSGASSSGSSGRRQR